MSRFYGKAPGILLVFSVAVVSYLFSMINAAFDPLAISIIFGLIISGIIEKEGMARGAEASLSFTLPVGIALYGIQLDFSELHMRLWPFALMAIAVTMLAGYFVCKGLGLGRPLSFLIATGLSICGASAIVVVAAAAGLRREDISTAVIAVMVAGLAGMVFYLMVPVALVLDASEIPLLLGSTLPMMGQVKVAANSYGPGVMDSAIAYKLIRISALAVVALAALAGGRRSGRMGRPPWFMVGFVLLAVLSNMSAEVASLRPAVGHVSAFILTSALAAIGLSLDFEVLVKNGSAPVVGAGISWAIASLAMTLALSIRG